MWYLNESLDMLCNLILIKASVINVQSSNSLHGLNWTNSVPQYRPVPVNIIIRYLTFLYLISHLSYMISHLPYLISHLTGLISGIWILRVISLVSGSWRRRGRCEVWRPDSVISYFHFPAAIVAIAPHIVVQASNISQLYQLRSKKCIFGWVADSGELSYWG